MCRGDSNLQPVLSTTGAVCDAGVLLLLEVGDHSTRSKKTGVEKQLHRRAAQPVWLELRLPVMGSCPGCLAPQQGRSFRLSRPIRARAG